MVFLSKLFLHSKAANARGDGTGRFDQSHPGKSHVDAHFGGHRSHVILGDWAGSFSDGYFCLFFHSVF